MFQYDRAIIELGNITLTSSGPGLAHQDEMIIATWYAVMIDNNQTQNGSVYWVSAGAEYEQESQIWVGQASLEANTGTSQVNYVSDQIH